MRVTVPAPVGLGKDTSRRANAREKLARVLWDEAGRRRLPSLSSLTRAMERCDRRDVWWVCEMNSVAPVYAMPTREWVRALARLVDRLHARSVLEVAAGDGFLSRCLARARPKLTVIATDNAAWAKPEARMNARERRAYRGIGVPGLRPGDGVQRLSATTAVRRYPADIVIVSWAPPGEWVKRLLGHITGYLIEIATDGNDCGGGPPMWRHAHELIDGPLENLALCRLDARPAATRHTRVTLYRGRA